MNRPTRRIIYLSFFAVFFILVPILVLYATGYRYNFKKNSLEKTGILIVESIPKKADVFLNDKLTKKTPTRFPHLLPDSYSVSVSKENYYPWTKQIEVKSGLTTFLKDIILFRQALPQLTVAGDINILAITPDQQKILYSLRLDDAQEQLRILNLVTNTDSLLDTLNPKLYNQLIFVQWSPDKNKALLNQKIGDFNSYLVINLDSLTSKSVFDITRTNFDEIKWDELDDSILYGLAKSALHKIELDTNLTQNILSAHITDFQVRGSNIYYITAIGLESFLNHSILNDSNFSVEKIKLPSPSNFGLRSAPKNRLILLDNKNQDLFIITTEAFGDLELENDILLQAQAKDLYWSKDFNQLIFFTDFELWTYDFSDDQPVLVNRFGSQIKKALWYPGNKYIIYQTSDSIHITETSPLGIKNDIELAKLKQLDNVVVDKSGQNLYFKGLVGNQAGMYQLILQ